MKIRAITGGVLAVFLLIFSCVSARCEVVCELGPLHSSGSRLNQTKSDTAEQATMDSMPGMEDCDGPSAASPDDGGARIAVKANCGHRVCEHESVVTQPEHSLDLRLFVAVFVTTLFPSKLQLSIGPLVAFDTPPPGSRTPLELNSILRL